MEIKDGMVSMPEKEYKEKNSLCKTLGYVRRHRYGSSVHGALFTVVYRENSMISKRDLRRRL